MRLVHLIAATIFMLICCSISLAVIAVWNAKDLGHRALQMYDGPLMAINLAQSARVNGKSADTAMEALMDLGYTAEAHEGFVYGIEDMQIDLEVMLEHNEVAEAPPLIERVMEISNQVLESSSPLLKEGKAPPAAIVDQLAQMDEILLEIVDQQTEHGYLTRQETEADAADTIRFITVSSSIGILLSICIATLVFLRFRAGLSSLSSSLHAMATGQLDYPVEGRHRKDEIGDMARELEEFRVSAEAFRSELETVMTAAAQGDFSRRVAAEKLGVNEQRYVAPLNGFVTMVEDAVNGMNQVLASFARGEFEHSLEGSHRGKLAELQAATRSSGGHLSLFFRGIETASAQIRTASASISDGAEGLSDRTTSQATALEQVGRSLENLARGLSAATGASSAAEELALKAATSTRDCREASVEANRVISGVSEQTRQIREIAVMVEDIAFQTNLLALNAGVEAARAGSAGSGFAVVASEVQQLANRTAEASKDISKLISGTSDALEDGAGRVLATVTSLSGIAEMIDDLHRGTQAVAEDGREQAAAIKDISSALAQVENETQSNVAAAERSADHARNLSALANEMRTLLNGFKSSGPISEESHKSGLNNAQVKAA